MRSEEIKASPAIGEFKDEQGVTRHAMSVEELDELYRKFDNFVADCTPEEVQENKDAIIKIKTMIHQRMR